MDTPVYSPEERHPETTAERERRLAHESVLIDEALAAAAAGDTVSFKAVEAWLDSLGTNHELPMPQSGR